MADKGEAEQGKTVAQNRRARFDYLHQLSTRLMMINMVGALLLLYWEARE